jgi:hypothetical protein
MQTNPPSVGNNVKLNPLGSAVDSIAYKNNLINLKGVEPSLGVPSGYSLTQPNTAYYFTVFSKASTYLESRKFTGDKSLVFVNNNIGYSNLNPTFNVDISGNFHALSAYIPNLSASVIVPADGVDTLTLNYSSGVYVNSNLYLNKDTYIKNLTAATIFANFLSAKKEIQTTIYNIFQLTGAHVTHDVNIGGSLTSTNVFASNSIISPFISAASAFFTNLTANYVTVNNAISVGGDLYANNFYGHINIDPFSQLYYNSNNQLSIGTNQNYVLAVRPSDAYSTDNTAVPRTLDGDWDSAYNTIDGESTILKPYFRTLQAVFNYIYNNGIFGNSLTIYVDEDTVGGEQPINGVYPYATSPYDNSGQYAGCTVTGNLSAGFFSTEWLGSNYPALTSAGLLGGDFLWPYDNNTDISGTFSYLNVPPLKFINTNVYARYEIGTKVNANGHKFYSTWRPYNTPPLKISYRTYICSNPNLSYGQFKDTTVPQLSTWNTVKTKSSVQGRQVSFSHDRNMSLWNLCFEFNTNSDDSTGLVFYNGTNRIGNLTVALKGNGIYTYGAIDINSDETTLQVCGGNLGDPTRYTNGTWTSLNYNGYDFGNPNYFPGYGLAIVGNSSPYSPTIVNYGTSTGYTGLININNGAIFDKVDYGTNRYIGRNTQLNSSLILDGNFNANALYELGDNVTVQGSEYLFKTNNFNLSSRNLIANNFASVGTPTYTLGIYDNLNYKVNFKYINYEGAFSTFNIYYYGYVNWTFLATQNIVYNYQNSNLSIYNGGNIDDKYIFNTIATPQYVDLTNSLLSIGSINTLLPRDHNGVTYSTQSKLYYLANYQNLISYDQYYSLSSPFNSSVIYTLNFYASSVR